MNLNANYSDGQYGSSESTYLTVENWGAARRKGLPRQATGSLVDGPTGGQVEYLARWLESAGHGRGYRWLVLEARQTWQARVQLRGCSQVACGVKVIGRAHVLNLGRITIATGVSLRSELAPVELFAWEGASIEVGEQSTLQQGASVLATADVSIGRNCTIGAYATIIACPEPGQATGKAKATVIEDNVTLGTRCLVGPGVRIGKGAVIAARAIVLDDVPPYSVASGTPAKTVNVSWS